MAAASAQAPSGRETVSVSPPVATLKTATWGEGRRMASRSGGRTAWARKLSSGMEARHASCRVLRSKAAMSDMAAFDLRTRQEAWRASIPLDSFLAHAVRPPDRLAIRLPSPQVAVFNVATGGLTDTVSLPEGAWADAAAIVGDVLVTAVRGYSGGEADIVGYRLDPLRRIWSVVLPVSPITDFTGDFTFSECGPLLCLRVD